MTKRLISRFALLAILLPTVAAALTVTASAATAAPVIRVSTVDPDHVTPGKFLYMAVNVVNVGDEPLAGNLTIRYTFPEGVMPADPLPDNAPGPACTPSGQVNECVIDVNGVPVGRHLLYVTLTSVDPGATWTLTGQVEVSGGGAINTVTVPLAFNTDPIGPFAVDSFDVRIKDNPAGQPAQAGGVPTEIYTDAELRSQAIAPFGFDFLTVVSAPESFRDVIGHVPPGVVGYPTATSQRCVSAQLEEPSAQPVSPSAQVPNCPRDSQIGLALVNGKDSVPVYNLVPPPGAPAMFAFSYQGVIVNLRAKLRPSDYGIDIVTSKVPSSVPISKFEVQLWGVPADSSHDGVRAECTEALLGAAMAALQCPSTAPRLPFLRMPTSCTGPLPWRMEIDTYQHPGVFHHADTTTAAPTGCEHNPFEPNLTVTPTSPATNSPTGIDTVLSMPQGFEPDGVAPADLRSAEVRLPKGLAINPAAADGLEACSDAQLGLGAEGPVQCPEAAKIGSIKVRTPLLHEALPGSVYLRTQNSKDPRSGEMYRLALVLHSEERGVDVKLPGSLTADPETGQLTAHFRDLPQLPFETLSMHLNTGPRASLTTPSACGTYETQAEFTSWGGKTVTLATPFTVGQGCGVPGFAPGFRAGSTNTAAGAFSPFILRVSRDPGMPNISRFDVTLPEGELAKLAGVQLCPEAQAGSGACPSGSRIGKVGAAVGEGPNPIFLPQPRKAPTALYLAGPYKGAPYSVVAAVPAQSGPFDLGTVTVRSALRVDPVTTQATVASDPLPQIFGGIPVSYRDLRVEVDRPNFTLNPTDCEPMTVRGTIESSTGGSANVSDRFQVGDCGALGFKPKLSLRLKGSVHRSAHPALTATLRARPGDANIARASVKLPPAAFLDQAHIKGVCTRVQFAADACPRNSVYGNASATTPILDYPLQGKVYLRSSSHKLPDLVAALHGPGTQPIEVALSGKTDSVKGALRNTFEAVPDAPVSRFRLHLFGGKRGLIEMSDGFCAHPRASIRLDAQNGKLYDSSPKVMAKCTKGKRGKRHGKTGR
jgi:hypothetical protein